MLLLALLGSSLAKQYVFHDQNGRLLVLYDDPNAAPLPDGYFALRGQRDAQYACYWTWVQNFLHCTDRYGNVHKGLPE